MNHSAFPFNPGTFWDFNSAAPYPTQDTDLLAQLPFIPGLKELLTLRQVHALEHGTVWMLGEIAHRGTTQKLSDNESLGGLSTDRGFYLYGSVPKIHLVRAVRQALERFRQGEWDLAVHPRCGTNLSVAMMLTTGLAMGTSWLLPKEPISQLASFGIAAAMASQISPDLGSWVQRHLTTAIPFNLEVKDIYPTTDLWGRSAYFVEVNWR
ncbi:MAG: DUF6391 domain-containing protein [Jaaginema sp. PMC 1079.18]|nr:DUF6391 domain-containing protein [Jaaginema sp. PMC 1080.18]MEC4852250.1 DUF6391 domain-containing protein [Jaaginema sp. PMC 1079.18]MEC4865080.1 DUF6391 domain-containing protein [Jaaginema sp. PMC 1078.18]